MNSPVHAAGCEDFTQCEDAALFCASLDSVWVVSHWISCCSGISTFCCCIGWTYGSCAWQCSLWHDYRARSWLQSPSIFLSTPCHFLPFFAYLLHSNACMSSNPCWPLPVCHRIGLENVFSFWVMNFYRLSRSEVCFESSSGNKPPKKWSIAHRLYTSQHKTWNCTFFWVCYWLILFFTAAPDHWRWLLWPWHECAIGCVRDGPRQASLHWRLWQNDLGHCLRLQEPLPGLCRDKERTTKEGKALKLWMDCPDGWDEGRDFVSLRWHVG